MPAGRQPSPPPGSRTFFHLPELRLLSPLKSGPQPLFWPWCPPPHLPSVSRNVSPPGTSQKRNQTASCFHVWLLSLSTRSSRFVRVGAGVRIPFLFQGAQVRRGASTHCSAGGCEAAGPSRLLRGAPRWHGRAPTELTVTACAGLGAERSLTDTRTLLFDPGEKFPEGTLRPSGQHHAGRGGGGLPPSQSPPAGLLGPGPGPVTEASAGKTLAGDKTHGKSHEIRGAGASSPAFI